MTHIAPHEQTFIGVRITLASDKDFDTLVADLLADIGDTPASLGTDYLSPTTDWDEYQDSIRGRIGPSGFMLFALLDHTGWINVAGIHKKLLRVVLGNPLIAITMLRYDLSAGLFAPVELLITEQDNNRSTLTYVKPSSLVAIHPDELLQPAAEALDEKLAALVAKAVG